MFLIRLTSIEQSMMKIIYSMQIPSRIYMQFPIGMYKADFAIPEMKVIIECSSDTWMKDSLTKKHDKKKDMELTQQGWSVLRFGEKEIKGDITNIKKTINIAIHDQQRNMKETVKRFETYDNHQRKRNKA